MNVVLTRNVAVLDRDSCTWINEKLSESTRTKASVQYAVIPSSAINPEYWTTRGIRRAKSLGDRIRVTATAMTRYTSPTGHGGDRHLGLRLFFSLLFHGLHGIHTSVHTRSTAAAAAASFPLSFNETSAK